MNRKERITNLKNWGEYLLAFDLSPYYQQIEKANPWFTTAEVDRAIQGIFRFLKGENLNKWSDNYPEEPKQSMTIGIIMAGNLPLVGMQDLLCVYSSGHKALIKQSSQDNILLPLLLNLFFSISPQSESVIRIIDVFDKYPIDAYLATGSDNTSRYIRYHYGNKSSIIRGNRTSVAVLKGDETREQLAALGHDMFSYYGRGCRNVSKVYVPHQYSFEKFISSNLRYQELTGHLKYYNNYRYQRSFHSTLGIKYVDTGYAILVRNPAIVSPLSVIYFEEYQDIVELSQIFERNCNKIQCLASSDKWLDKSYAFGTLQSPDLWDYADNTDTMKFLLNL